MPTTREKLRIARVLDRSFRVVTGRPAHAIDPESPGRITVNTLREQSADIFYSLRCLQGGRWNPNITDVVQRLTEHLYTLAPLIDNPESPVNDPEGWLRRAISSSAQLQRRTQELSKALVRNDGRVFNRVLQEILRPITDLTSNLLTLNNSLNSPRIKQMIEGDDDPFDMRWWMTEIDTALRNPHVRDIRIISSDEYDDLRSWNGLCSVGEPPDVGWKLVIETEPIIIEGYDPAGGSHKLFLRPLTIILSPLQIWSSMRGPEVYLSHPDSAPDVEPPEGVTAAFQGQNAADILVVHTHVEGVTDEADPILCTGENKFAMSSKISMGLFSECVELLINCLTVYNNGGYFKIWELYPQSQEHSTPYEVVCPSCGRPDEAAMFPFRIRHSEWYDNIGNIRNLDLSTVYCGGPDCMHSNRDRRMNYHTLSIGEIGALVDYGLIETP